MTPILVEKLGAIDIGRQGENLARTVKIDVSSLLTQWPEAMITLLVKRKGDTEPYFAETTLAGNILYWPITSVETANAGDGKIEIQAVSGDVIAKTVTGTIRVSTSLSGTASDNPPDTHPGWVDEVLEAGGMISAQAEELESTTLEVRETIATLTDTVDTAVAQAKADTAAAADAANKATADAIAATVELALTAGVPIVCDSSGDLITISDGADRPAVSLVSYIEPVQEGEGDPYPGRGSRNLAHLVNSGSYASQGLSFTFEDENYFLVNGTSTTEGSVRVASEIELAAGEYVLSLFGANRQSAYYDRLYVADANGNVLTNNIVVGTPMTFTVTEATTVSLGFVFGASSTYRNQKIRVQLEVGSTATEYVSYSNVRPIRGWDEVVVRRTGKNLAQPILTKETPKTYKGITYCRNADDSVSLEGTATAAFFLHICNASVKEGVAYKMKGISGASATTYQLYTDSEFIKLYPGDSVNSATAVKDGVTAIRFAVYEGITIDMTIYPQLEIGDNVTAYEPYEGQTLTAELPETIYAGILDWNTGILTKYNRVVYDGVTAGLMMTGTDPNVINYTHPYAYSKAFQTVTNGALAVNKMKILTPQNTYNYVASANEGVIATTVISIKMSRERIGWEEGDTKEDIITKINAVLNQWYLDGEPLEVVYIPENPETVQLSPQQLETLKGTNNVWSRTGKTELTYIADTKMYIDNKLTAIAAATLNT